MAILTLNPVKDAYIDTYTNTNTNYGSGTILKYGHYGTNGSYNLYLQFDLTAIPSLAVINSAKIRLYISSVTGGQTLRQEMLYTISGNWVENTITCNNRPQYLSNYKTFDLNINSTNSGTWIEFDIKSIVDNWMSGTPNYGIGMSSNPIGFNSDIVLNIPSRENADSTKIPQLVIDCTIPAPSTPTNLSPANGYVVNIENSLLASWQHNPATPGVQGKFDLVWRLQGSGTWNSITQTTANQFYQFTTNTFTKGYIEWQVRTYDLSSQVSPWSGIAVFKIVQKPPTPTITNPVNNSTVTGGQINAQWTASEQVGYKVRLTNSLGNTLWEKVETSTNKGVLVDYLLQNNTSYKLYVSVKNVDELYSNESLSNITVIYAAPPAPILTISLDKERGSIIINIENNEASMPSALYSNEIYRRIQGETKWIRIGLILHVNVPFIDYSPSHGQIYEYKVRAVLETKAYTDSSVVAASASVSNSQVALVSDYSQWVKLKYNPSKIRTKTYNRALMYFEGRDYPIAEFKPQKEDMLLLTFTIFKEELNKLLDIIDIMQTVLFRDSRGKRIFGTIGAVEVEDDIIFGFHVVRFTIDRVGYIEEV